MNITVSKLGININGQEEIILCGSLFYFRIPRDEWEDRIVKLKYAGYNAIDVYFPWNFHEQKEGVFSFEDEKDIKEFLAIAHKHKMYVVARPGPYICSEYDMGALPPFLLTKEGIVLRDNNEIYLSYVKKYFDQILPILSEYQLGKKGSIIMLQIENELDFYKRVCKDQYGYIEALYEMTLPHQFYVPVIACAGEGDEKSATGLYENVVPTFNFYPHGNSLKFEEISKAKSYELYKRDIPLMITETNRATSQLRRLLYTGVKLLGPYNQVGGNDFGFSNAVNNWGKPLTYLTSDYDFGGLIKPHGSFSNDIYESKLFGKFIKTFGQKLASGFIENKQLKYKVNNEPFDLGFVYKMIDNTVFYTVSAFKEGGNLQVFYDDLVLPQKANIKIVPRQNNFFIHNLDLCDYGVNLKIDYALFEINQIIKDDKNLYLISLYEDETEMMINDEVIVLNKQDYKIEVDGIKVIFRNLSRTESALLRNINYGVNIFEEDLHFEDSKINTIDEIKYQQVSSNLDMKFAKYKDNTTWLEDNGLYNGYGIYHFYEGDEGIGLYVEEASDIVTIYQNGKGIYSDVSANTPLLVETNISSKDKLEIKAEIWGHTNFHDERLPNLFLNSKRGIRNVYLLLNKKVIDLENKIDITTCSVLSFEGDVTGKVTINGDIYKVDKFNKQINLCKYIGTKIRVKEYFIQDVEFSSIVYESQEMKLHKQTLVDEENFTNYMLEQSPNKVSKLPFDGTLGGNYLISLDIENNDKKGKYLLFDATGVKITVLFNNKVINRLFFNENNRVKMTGGGKNRVYLPKTWFKGAVGKVVMFVEVLNHKNEITQIELFNVNT